jgi:SAM-dependent MidA family methyltransferase
MPVHVFQRDGGRVRELGVGLEKGEFRWTPSEEHAPAAIDPSWFPQDGYRSEVQLVARAFIQSVGRMLARGAAFFIDYGFPRREYYHPQRSACTLMCHYRHRAHDDAFFLPGLQDITSHIDFTAITEAGRDAGLELLGYTNQAQFLVNCGITDLLAETSPSDAGAYAPLAAQAQKLLSPAEMGEFFKVIALGRGVPSPLLGFAGGDKRHSL